MLINSVLIYCFICDETRRKYIPINLMLQMLHQVTVMNRSFAIYVSSAKTVVWYKVFMCVSEEIQEVVFNALNLVNAGVVKRTHETGISILYFGLSNRRSAIQSQLDLCAAVNKLPSLQNILNI